MLAGLQARLDGSRPARPARLFMMQIPEAYSLNKPETRNVSPQREPEFFVADPWFRQGFRGRWSCSTQNGRGLRVPRFRITEVRTDRV